MAVNQKSPLNALYCEEEEEVESGITFKNENDLEDDDQQLLLQSLLSREREASVTETVGHMSRSRKVSVEWILRVKSHHGFSAFTALLAVNYFDRFCFSFHHKDELEASWMPQLVAVASLSLAAKLEETNLPLLLHLQVEEDGTYLFEAKTIQRMELLILSALKWRMNPVTPLCFVNHIVKRVRLKNYSHWECFRSCENLILSLIADSRFVRYLPSVLAAATMLHIINQLEPSSSNAIHYQNHILGAFKINKEEVEECKKQVSELVTSQNQTTLAIFNNTRDSSSDTNDSWERNSVFFTPP